MKFLFCTDGSDSADKAFDSLLKIIKKKMPPAGQRLRSLSLQMALSETPTMSTNPAFEPTVIIMTVQTSSFFRDILGELPQTYTDRQEAKQYDKLLNMLEEYAVRAQEVGVSDVRTRVIDEGSPKDVIVKCAKRENVDMVVIGASRNKGMQKTFLGSTAEYVVRNVKCPVLIGKIPKKITNPSNSYMPHSPILQPRNPNRSSSAKTIPGPSPLSQPAPLTGSPPGPSSSPPGPSSSPPGLAVSPSATLPFFPPSPPSHTLLPPQPYYMQPSSSYTQPYYHSYGQVNPQAPNYPGGPFGSS